MIRLRNASRLTPSLILRFKIKTNREQVSFVSKHETFIFWTSFDYFSHFVHQNISQSLILSRWCVCVERLHVTPASWQFGFISKKKKKRENVVRMSVCHFFFYIFNLPQGRRFWNCWSRVFFFFFENKNPPTPPSSLQNGVPQNIPHFLRIHPRSPSSRHSRPLPKFELKNVLSFAGLCEKNVIKTFFFF